jgi:putative Ca2+/H+ antiporter (TMEM165/GDT1 family)
MFDLKLMFPVFLSVFLAELGDKTQIATMTFAAEGTAGRWGVFVAASAALILATFLGVMVGDLLGRFIDPRILKLAAGCVFVVIGCLVVYQSLRA